MDCDHCGYERGRLAAIDVAIRRLLPRKRALRSAGRGRGFSIAESDEYDALRAEIDALELEESALLLADIAQSVCCLENERRAEKAEEEVEQLRGLIALVRRGAGERSAQAWLLQLLDRYTDV